jgi:hypothetical protein
MNIPKSFSNMFYLTVIVIFIYLILEVLFRLLGPECFSQSHNKDDTQSKSLLQQMINTNILNYIWTTPKSVR